MADYLDTVNAVVVGNMISNPSRGDFADDAARTRAKAIEDNFGIKPQSLDQYSDKHGGRGIMKFLGWAAAGLAVGALFHVAVAALLVGAVVGAISMGHQRSKVRRGYGEYLDNVASQGRNERDHSRAPTLDVEYDNGRGNKSFTADLEASRVQRAYAGANR